MTTLVVVDDESLVTDFLTFLLEAEGYTVHVAFDGRQGLELIERVCPALVITDLMMPVLSGLALAEALRASESFRNMPVILCSAVPVPLDRNTPLFTAVLRKPYPPATLLEVVAGALRDAGHDAGGAGRC